MKREPDHLHLANCSALVTKLAAGESLQPRHWSNLANAIGHSCTLTAPMEKIIQSGRRPASNESAVLGVSQTASFSWHSCHYSRFHCLSRSDSTSFASRPKVHEKLVPQKLPTLRVDYQGLA